MHNLIKKVKELESVYLGQQDKLESLDILIEIIEESNKLIFVENANNDIDDLEEIKEVFKSNEELRTIIQKQIENIKDKIPSLKIKNSGLVSHKSIEKAKNGKSFLSLTNIQDLPIGLDTETTVTIQSVDSKYTIMDINGMLFRVRTTKKNPPECNGLYEIKKINYGKHNQYFKLVYKFIQKDQIDIISKKIDNNEIINNDKIDQKYGIDIDDILFIDIEPYNNSEDNQIREIGIVFNDLELKSTSIKVIRNNIESVNIKFVCGHNYASFDKFFINNSALSSTLNKAHIIDTLELSYLFFPHTEVHKLPKNYFSKDNFSSDPLKDSKLTKELLFKLITKFNSLDERTRNLYYSLLKDHETYSNFFKILDIELDTIDIFETLIADYGSKIEDEVYLKEIIKNDKLSLAFIIGIFNKEIMLYTFSPVIMERFPQIQEIFNKLVFNAEKEISNLESYLKDSFNFDGFRPPFPTSNNSEFISQRDIVAASLKDENIFTILPTGGGKTLTFWLPAIIKAKKTRGLTVVISPLQALMKDHIYNFNDKLLGLSSAAALSGYLTMPERREIQAKIINGSLDILYIAPESLRSKNLENILTYRYIDRFVIDEAHCLSTWGNDFRHDYFYIAEFIKKIVLKKEKKYKQKCIPLSVFTATANIKTINEIKNYFKTELDINFNDFIASSKRNNLHYKAYKVEKEIQKKEKIIELLKSINDDASLIYVPSSRKKCEDLAEQLSNDLNKTFVAFHAGISSKERSKILEDYIADKISGIVATTAFGMGIDKPNIRHVIHYEISSSLEDYLQESGRAGRDGNDAYCYIVYEDKDFSKLFYSLINQKLTFNEIKKVFQSIKQYKGRKKHNEDKKILQVSIKDLAESIGLETDDEKSNYDSKIKTALLELERCKYIKRGYNKPNLYVTSLNIESIEQAHKIINDADFNDDYNPKMAMIRIIEILIKKSTKTSSLHIEDLAELINEDIDKLYKILYAMRDINLIGLKEDILISNFEKNKFNSFINTLITVFSVLKEKIFLFNKSDFQIRELNQMLKDNGIDLIIHDKLLPKILMLFRSKGQFEFYRYNVHMKRWHLNIINQKYLKDKIESYSNLLQVVAEFINNKYSKNQEIDKRTFYVPYHDMIDICNSKLNNKHKINDYDKLILLLAHTKFFNIEGGRVVYDSKIEIEIDDIHLNNKGYKYYTELDYSYRMKPMYNFKRESFHIINRYAEELLQHEIKAKQFSLDYFDLGYKDFIKKYTLDKRIKLPLPEAQYQKILNENTTTEQKNIIQDTKHNSMLILAGPGTGKTQVLINKIAYMIIEENYKPEHFLMLTYTKAASLVFKNRLFKLIGDLAYNIDIFTFHGYAIELLGEYKKDKHDNNSLQNSIQIIKEKIKNNEVSLGFKQVIILDEFQDTGEEAYSFVKELYEKFSYMNDSKTGIKIIAVGDDDQCIMSSLNGASIDYMHRFKKDYSHGFKQFELTTNFRSKQSIVDFSNTWIKEVTDRIDENKIIKANVEGKLLKSLFSSHSSGKVSIVKYNSPNFLTTFYNKYLQDNNAKEIAILTHENQTVLDIYSLLKLNNHSEVKYLLKDDGFKLYQLDEIIRFNEILQLDFQNNDDHKIISHDQFNKAKNILFEEYKDSKNIDSIKRHLYDFEKEHDILTFSFWDSYIQETSIDTFHKTETRVLVSTIHRAKGSEFEEVHIVLNKLHNQEDVNYFKRLYYVAITRAKENLFIHTSTDVFDFLKGINTQRITTQESLFTKRLKIMQLDDIHLGFKTNFGFSNRILAGSQVKFIKSKNFNGYTYQINYIDANNNEYTIGQVSNKFKMELDSFYNSGYLISEAIVKYRIHYKLKDKNEINIIYLCEIIFEKNV